jgi:hypothetical protein
MPKHLSLAVEFETWKTAMHPTTKKEEDFLATNTLLSPEFHCLKLGSGDMSLFNLFLKLISIDYYKKVERSKKKS